ncbi:MAG: hypothetical protein QM729_21380 [Solirubrobacterales bacterium]
MLQTKVDASLSLLHAEGEAFVVFNLFESDGTVKHLTLSVVDWSYLIAKPGTNVRVSAVLSEEVETPTEEIE